MLACNSHYYLPSSGDKVLTHTYYIDAGLSTASNHETLGGAIAAVVVLLQVFFACSEQKLHTLISIQRNTQKRYRSSACR